MSLLPILLVALQSAPPALEDLAALEARVVAVTGTGVGSPGGPLHPIDRRLRLHRCLTPAEIAPVRGGLAVACPERGWRIHVALGQGGGDAGLAAGQRAAGPVIRRGDAVAVRMQGRGFAVVLRAIALEDGAIGARIRLRRTAGPTTPIAAIVTGPGEAALAT